MSSSKSRSTTNANTTNTTQNQDNRLNLSEGGVGGTASAGGTVNITTVDAGAMDLAKTSISTANDSLGDLSKMHERTYDQLIDKYDGLLQAGKYLIDKNTDLASQAVKSWSPTSSGDTEISKNNSMAIMAGAGVLALVFLMGKR
jgi:hypothetical protein